MGKVNNFKKYLTTFNLIRNDDELLRHLEKIIQARGKSLNHQKKMKSIVIKLVS